MYGFEREPNSETLNGFGGMHEFEGMYESMVTDVWTNEGLNERRNA